jgi:hypothetical protein
MSATPATGGDPVAGPFLITAFQLFSFSAFRLVPQSHFSFSAFQRFSF